MAERARELVQHLRENGFDRGGGVNRQVLNLAEEVGEFVGAYRRWTGQARRSGTEQEVHAELADVVITAYVTAAEMEFDLDEAIRAKLDIVFTRGWREKPPEGEGLRTEPDTPAEFGARFNTRTRRLRW